MGQNVGRMMNLNQLKEKGLAPEFYTEESLKTVLAGYLAEEEDTPLDMYRRVSKAAASALNRQDLEVVFFDILWKGWLGAATPVLSNLGTDRGLPISCFSIHTGDSVSNIFTKAHELAMLSKNGGGVGIYLGDVRGRGAAIKGNGKSEGIIPWAKVFDQTTVSVSQGGVRRGASALYLPVEHSDAEEFINIRRPTGDPNRRCLNTNNAMCISDDFMNKVKEGDPKARHLWTEILKARVETGEPYLFFTDNVNRKNPECYKANHLKVSTSNICSEIMLHTDIDHTFVCCLSSLNLSKWDEWSTFRFSNGMSVPEASTWFLEAVITSFIKDAKNIEGLQNSVRFAEKSRALGLGVLGWHTLLQSRSIAFDSFQAMMLNAQVFKFIRDEATKASKLMALSMGEPEWCKGFGIRHTHLMAIAPTVSNSTICGSVSSGIEPITSNCYAFKSAKGTFIRKNPQLELLLKKKNKDLPEVWDEIISEEGSVQTLKFLSEEERSIFQTAREINQFALVNQAAQRQAFIDQGQSLNLFFAANAEAKYINQVHIRAWEQGLKTLYYLRSSSVLRGDIATKSKDECKACEG